jgi:hypothetical protein
MLVEKNGKARDFFLAFLFIQSPSNGLNEWSYHFLFQKLTFFKIKIEQFPSLHNKFDLRSGRILHLVNSLILINYEE